MPKKARSVEPEEPTSVPVQPEKERLLELLQTLKDLNIRSISDLENLIARAS
jgi:hypothetical protein